MAIPVTTRPRHSPLADYAHGNAQRAGSVPGRSEGFYTARAEGRPLTRLPMRSDVCQMSVQTKDGCRVPTRTTPTDFIVDRKRMTYARYITRQLGVAQTSLATDARGTEGPFNDEQSYGGDGRL
jgi:hypothetical protein